MALRGVKRDIKRMQDGCEDPVALRKLAKQILDCAKKVEDERALAKKVETFTKDNTKSIGSLLEDCYFCFDPLLQGLGTGGDFGVVSWKCKCTIWRVAHCKCVQVKLERQGALCDFCKAPMHTNIHPGKAAAEQLTAPEESATRGVNLTRASSVNDGQEAGNVMQFPAPLPQGTTQPDVELDSNPNVETANDQRLETIQEPWPNIQRTDEGQRLSVYAGPQEQELWPRRQRSSIRRRSGVSQQGQSTSSTSLRRLDSVVGRRPRRVGLS